MLHFDCTEEELDSRNSFRIQPLNCLIKCFKFYEGSITAYKFCLYEVGSIDFVQMHSFVA